jgi:hypothetical protein
MRRVDCASISQQQHVVEQVSAMLTMHGVSVCFGGCVAAGCHKVRVEEGATLCLPPGWIFAQHAPKEAVVFAGYFLCDFAGDWHFVFTSFSFYFYFILPATFSAIPPVTGTLSANRQASLRVCSWVIRVTAAWLRVWSLCAMLFAFLLDCSIDSQPSLTCGTIIYPSSHPPPLLLAARNYARIRCVAGRV